MPIYFANEGAIDLDVIRTMGVSVKTGDNPIGYFGTGLKYAIATLLRTKHKVSLTSAGATVQFTTKTKEVRGQPFDFVMMGEEQLGYTTELGKNWEVWQAYRELYANCMDEGGKVSGQFAEMDTIFTVTGEGILDAHAERGKIFLTDEPFCTMSGLDIHNGRSNYVFYRGVRAYELRKPSRYTYNVTVKSEMTEDRTLKSQSTIDWRIGTRLPYVANENFARRILDPDWKGYESTLNFGDASDPSDEFLDALGKLHNNARLPESRRDYYRKFRRIEKNSFEAVAYESTIAEACLMLVRLDCHVSPSELIFVESLGAGIYAAVVGGEILISRQCLDNGRDFLAITIYEEWLHLRFGLDDESRGMQQFLFDKLLGFISPKQ